MAGRKRNQSLLVQLGAMIVAVFLVIALVNSLFVYRSNQRSFDIILTQHVESALNEARDYMEEYRSLPWLLEYWLVHREELSAELKLRKGMEGQSDAVWRTLLERGIDSLEAVTSEEAETFSAEDQRLFAKACYLAIERRFDTMGRNFGMENLNCVTLINRDTAYPLLHGRSEEEQAANYSPLGEKWPFNADLHPAIDEMYAEREDRLYVEKVTSTVNGVEYLFSYLPLVMDGETMVYLYGARTLTEVNRHIASLARTTELINAVLLTLYGVGLLLSLYLLALRPLKRVQTIVQQYRKSKDSDAAREALDAIRSRNEIGRIAHDISLLAAALDWYMDESNQLAVEQERISTELGLATEIQANMLPSIFPAFPERREFDLYATMDPAKEVGGDFYDFFMTDDDHLAMVAADVSGKGVPAALFMMIAKAILKTKVQEDAVPSEALLAANAALAENNSEDMFVTVWLGVLELSTGRLTYANAGHEKLLLCRQGKWDFVSGDYRGVALAAFEPEDLDALPEKYQFHDHVVQLQPGDALFQYTDGVTEATNANDELFGDGRLLEAINSAPSAEPRRLLPYIRGKIDEFAKGVEQFDDITMLGMQYKGTITE